MKKEDFQAKLPDFERHLTRNLTNIVIAYDEYCKLRKYICDELASLLGHPTTIECSGDIEMLSMRPQVVYRFKISDHPIVLKTEVLRDIENIFARFDILVNEGFDTNHMHDLQISLQNNLTWAYYDWDDKVRIMSHQDILEKLLSTLANKINDFKFLPTTDQ